MIGVACAIAVLRRAPTTGARAVTSAVATVFVWPLWAPFALGAARPVVARRGPDSASVGRIDRALAEAA